MLDIKILVIRDFLTIGRVERVPHLTPLSVRITGEQLQEASQVLINDRAAPEFIVLSASQIVAQVPDSERQTALRKVAVLAERPSAQRNSLLHFAVSLPLSGLRGIERLVQLFCKLLLQTPGSDRFHPTLGGGLLSLVGTPISRKNTRSLQSEILSAINRTRDQLVSLQGQAPGHISLDERLLTVRMDGLGFHPNTTTISTELVLSAVSGKQAVANLTF